MLVYQSKRENHTGKNTREAQAIVERALGKAIPLFAEIHHVDGNPGNNKPSNLVLCEDASYHKLLHVRTEAFLACKNANWKICWICKTYDKPENLKKNRRGFVHTECFRQYLKERPVQNFCCYCKKTDSPKNLSINIANGQAYHKECAAQYRQTQRENRQLKILFECLNILEGGD